MHVLQMVYLGLIFFGYKMRVKMGTKALADS